MGVGGGDIEFSLDGFKINPRRTSLADAVDFLESGVGGTETGALRLWGAGGATADAAWLLVLRL